MAWRDEKLRAWDTFLREFGVTTTYFPPGSAPSEDVTVIFKNEHDPLTFGDLTVSSRRPMAHAKLSDFVSAPVKLGEFEPLDGARYRIVDVQPDGHGGAAMPLEKV